MDKMSFESANITSANINKIAELFPAAITETLDEEQSTPEKKIYKKAVNFEVLRSMLGDEVGGDEAYEFTWVGKREAIREAGRPIRKTLRPCVEESKNWDTTENLYIEGDNLDVLKLLQESYLGKVKMIYIDPPYNTGSDRFLYPDNYIMNRDEYEEEIGVLDENENILFKENNMNNPRFHSDWCSMMFSRLMLARNLLTEDGAIFIHIDEHELFNLKKIADEVLGESCFVNIISIKTKIAGVSGSYMGKSLQNNTEYLLAYCRNQHSFLIDNIPKKKQELMDFIQSYVDDGKSWKYTSVLKEIDEGEYVKTIKAGNGAEIRVFKHKKYLIVPITKIAKSEFNDDLKAAYYHYIDKIFRTTNAQTSIRTCVIRETNDIDSDLISIEYIPNKGKNAGQVTRIYYKDSIRNMVAYLKEVVSIELDGIFKLDNAGNLWDDLNYNNLANEAGLSFPNGQKPVQLLMRIIKMFKLENEIIMDFFSGSATTAHAVIKLNSLDQANRKFIMIQLPELCETNSDFYKAGYKNICEIGKERIRRAGEKIKEEEGLMAQDLDIGFRVLKLDDTNMKDVYYAADEYNQDMLAKLASNIKDDRTETDLLYGCLLDWGLPLSMPHTHEEFDGVTIHNYNNGDLMACFASKISEKVVKEIAKRQPLRVVFRDSSFSSSPEKINVEEIFKLLAPKTTVKVL